MKTGWLMLILLLVFVFQEVNAQVWLKAEYIGSSGFRDVENKKVDGKGDMKVIQGGVNIPVSMKMDENNHPTAWMVGLGASYASMDNKNLSGYVDIPQIFNAQLAVSYIYIYAAVCNYGVATRAYDHKVAVCPCHDRPVCLPRRLLRRSYAEGHVQSGGRL